MVQQSGLTNPPGDSNAHLKFENMDVGDSLIINFMAILIIHRDISPNEIIAFPIVLSGYSMDEGMNWLMV